VAVPPGGCGAAGCPPVGRGIGMAYAATCGAPPAWRMWPSAWPTTGRPAWPPGGHAPSVTLAMGKAQGSDGSARTGMAGCGVARQDGDQLVLALGCDRSIPVARWSRCRRFWNHTWICRSVPPSSTASCSRIGSVGNLCCWKTPSMRCRASSEGTQRDIFCFTVPDAALAGAIDALLAEGAEEAGATPLGSAEMMRTGGCSGAPSSIGTNAPRVTLAGTQSAPVAGAEVDAEEEGGHGRQQREDCDELGMTANTWHLRSRIGALVCPGTLGPTRPPMN
jgi:hypothetical protein